MGRGEARARLPEPSLTKKLPSGPTAIIRSDIGCPPILSNLAQILKQGLDLGAQDGGVGVLKLREISIS